jgi:hypothetical protein
LNQLFFDVFQSPRRDSLIQAKSEALKHLQLLSAFSLENTEGRLKQVFDRRLNVRDLRHIGRILAARFFLPPPGISGTRSEPLGRFEEHWSIIEPALIEIAVGKS